MNHTASGGAHGLAKCGAGIAFSQAGLDLIKVGELKQDPRNQSRRLIGRFKKFPPHMRMAAHEGDPGFVFGPRLIDDVGIALNDVGQFAKIFFIEKTLLACRSLSNEEVGEDATLHGGPPFRPEALC